MYTWPGCLRQKLFVIQVPIYLSDSFISYVFPQCMSKVDFRFLSRILNSLHIILVMIWFDTDYSITVVSIKALNLLLSHSGIKCVTEIVACTTV